MNTIAALHRESKVSYLTLPPGRLLHRTFQNSL